MGSTHWSFCRYNCGLVFIFFVGSLLGHALGDILSAKNSEYEQHDFLRKLLSEGSFAWPDRIELCRGGLQTG